MIRATVKLRRARHLFQNNRAQFIRVDCERQTGGCRVEIKKGNQEQQGGCIWKFNRRWTLKTQMKEGIGFRGLAFKSSDIAGSRLLTRIPHTPFIPVG
jgi:hypothetical protein